MGEVACRAGLWYNGVLIRFCRSVAVNNLRRDARKASFSHMDSLSSDIPLRQCSNPDCKQWFPATPEFFFRKKAHKDGLEGCCKECHKRRDRAYNNRPEIIEHRRIQTKAYRSLPEVKERRRVNLKTAYQSHSDVRERVSRANKKYRSRPEVKEHIHAREKAYASRPETKEKDRMYSHKRIARKKAIPGTYTPEQIQDLLKRQKHRCYYCSVKFERANGRYAYHIDHTFPLSRVAGTDIPANDISYLVLACPTCNISKQNKYPWEWHEGGKLL